MVAQATTQVKEQVKAAPSAPQPAANSSDGNNEDDEAPGFMSYLVFSIALLLVIVFVANQFFELQPQVSITNKLVSNL